MDCLCCVDAGAGPTSDQEFLGHICDHTINQNLDVKFPAEPNRYLLYVVAGCPFAARPWSVLAFYGLLDTAVQVVKLFPAAADQSWFFTPQSDGEHDLVRLFPSAQVDTNPVHTDMTHLKQLYLHAKPEFRGVVSVPLLWDTVQDTAVSNNSLEMARMLATHMRRLAKQNADIALFPCPDADGADVHAAHEALLQSIHTNITTAVYRINACANGVEHDAMVQAYYAQLDQYEALLQQQTYLMGNDTIRFADILLLISLIRLDLAYQWRFGLGRSNVREDYPTLWQYVQRILHIPGMAATVLPRDIMALYFLTPKWVTGGCNGRTLPLVPASWERSLQLPNPNSHQDVANNDNNNNK